MANTGIRVIAEGIENLEQMQKISELGADEVQGYLLGRPISDLELQLRLLLGSDGQIVGEHATTNGTASSLPLCLA